MAKGECSCWCEYPNERCKRRNTWKCVDKYECVRNLIPYKKKTLCRKRVDDDGETAERTEATRH